MVITAMHVQKINTFINKTFNPYSIAELERLAERDFLKADEAIKNQQ
jgi:hypothetical protein